MKDKWCTEDATETVEISGKYFVALRYSLNLTKIESTSTQKVGIQRIIVYAQ